MCTLLHEPENTALVEVIFAASEAMFRTGTVPTFPIHFRSCPRALLGNPPRAGGPSTISASPASLKNCLGNPYRYVSGSRVRGGGGIVQEVRLEDVRVHQSRQREEPTHQTVVITVGDGIANRYTGTAAPPPRPATSNDSPTWLTTLSLENGF